MFIHFSQPFYLRPKGDTITLKGAAAVRLTNPSHPKVAAPFEPSRPYGTIIRKEHITGRGGRG